MRLRKSVVALAATLTIGLALGASPAVADTYEADRAGHPFRILAYALHPVGVAFDYLLLRPVHWLGHRQPFRTLFGDDDH